MMNPTKLVLVKYILFLNYYAETKKKKILKRNKIFTIILAILRMVFIFLWYKQRIKLPSGRSKVTRD